MGGICEVVGCDEPAEYIDCMGDFICSDCMMHALENEGCTYDDFELTQDNYKTNPSQ